MTIAGKVTLITGGSSGIGKQLAYDMAKRGAKIIIASRNKSLLLQTQKEMARLGYDIAVFGCDVTQQSQIDLMVNEVLAKYARLDILVNNAGYAVYETFEESDLREVLRLVDVNLLGAIRCLKGFLPSMIARRAGQIVNVASIAGRMVITPNCLYTAAKHGLVALSEALRYELGYFGIDVNVICPGRIETPFFDHETFQRRAKRPETKYTVPIEKVSRRIIQAIEKNRFMTYIPGTLGMLVWVTNTFSFIVKPLYGRLLTNRIQTLYRSK